MVSLVTLLMGLLIQRVIGKNKVIRVYSNAKRSMFEIIKFSWIHFTPVSEAP